MRRPNPNKQDYPMMLYHCIKGTKIVKDAEELKSSLEEGWTRHCDIAIDQEETKAKIAYHKREIEKLEALLPKATPPSDEVVKVTKVARKRAKPK